MLSLKYTKIYSLLAVLAVIALLVGLDLPSTLPVQAATQIDLVGPAGSGHFGLSVTALPNGNIVVTDPSYAAGSLAEVGAVYLYNGATRALISTLTGNAPNDQVGSGGITVLSNGNYIVYTRSWNNGKGAVTWVNGATGLAGVVSSSNSLVGSKENDQVGYGGVTALNNGNYVVSSPYWDNGNIQNAGAVTWGNGVSGRAGEVSSSNSLVGSRADDYVSSGGVTALNNGNYVVSSPLWNSSTATDVGAVTWGNGASGRAGEVSSSNSLVGSKANDQVGSNNNKSSGSVTALSNGNYVVSSSFWDNGNIIDAGAVTWGNGASGLTTGVINSSNSLVGSTASDQVGYGDVTALISNGNYVVSSPNWNNGNIVDAGAVTWGNGASGRAGALNSSNSLVGNTTDDQVGNGGVTALSNGNYVVSSPNWGTASSTTINIGAVTLCNGASGRAGAISSSNSLVGSRNDDLVGGGGVTALSNGNYVVSSPNWDNSSITNVGAVTWGNGASGLTGAVSISNSLVGSRSGDYVGYGGVTALSNGNYVVSSPNWDNSSTTNAGAVTWGNGASGRAGSVSSSNSLVGNVEGNQIGSGGVTALSNGNYVVNNPEWSGSRGAVTWSNGNSGSTGAISSSNSLVGDRTLDRVGNYGVTALSNGNYVVFSADWDNSRGAITWGNGDGATTGKIVAQNSVLGTAGTVGGTMSFTYDYAHQQLIVGRQMDNTVTFFIGDFPLAFENHTGQPVTVKLIGYNTRDFPANIGRHVWPGIPVGNYEWQAAITCNGQSKTIGSTQMGDNHRAPITIQPNQTAMLNAEEGGKLSCPTIYLPLVVKPLPTGALTFKNDSGSPVTVTLFGYNQTKTFVGPGPHLWSNIPAGRYEWEAKGTCNGQSGVVGSNQPTNSPNYRAPITIQANETSTLNAEKGGRFSCGG